MHRKGYRFFTDDEDAFGLEDVLQAAAFMYTGSTFVPAKPWHQGSHSKVVSSQPLLGTEVQQLLTQMQQEKGCNTLH